MKNQHISLVNHMRKKEKSQLPSTEGNGKKIGFVRTVFV